MDKGERDRICKAFCDFAAAATKEWLESDASPDVPEYDPERDEETLINGLNAAAGPYGFHFEADEGDIVSE